MAFGTAGRAFYLDYSKPKFVGLSKRELKAIRIMHLMHDDPVESAKITRQLQLAATTAVSKAKKAKVSLAKISWGG